MYRLGGWDSVIAAAQKAQAEQTATSELSRLETNAAPDD
jgi:hypothetical protein